MSRIMSMSDAWAFAAVPGASLPNTCAVRTSGAAPGDCSTIVCVSAVAVAFSPMDFSQTFCLRTQHPLHAQRIAAVELAVSAFHDGYAVDARGDPRRELDREHV